MPHKKNKRYKSLCLKGQQKPFVGKFGCFFFSTYLGGLKEQCKMYERFLKIFKSIVKQF